jgi:chemotaxis protein MotB
MKRLLLTAVFPALLMFSCVPARLHNEIKAKKEACEKENEELKAAQLRLTTREGELSAMTEDLRKKVTDLQNDTAALGRSLRTLQADYRRTDAAYQALLKDGPASASNAEASRQLIRDLQQAREELISREDQLSQKERLLRQKEDSLVMVGRDLGEKNRRLAELEQMLEEKDKAANDLRNSVTNALTGYKDKGLSVELKNGKVYVLMEERLLFATGSTTVGAAGVDALRDLGRVLEKNKDISIQIEGHTDDVPMKGAGEIKDNWDLSVMRATQCVKILLSNSAIDPVRITAAGRSQYLPVDPAKTAAARGKNRRIEVILTPKLDQLLKLLETH